MALPEEIKNLVIAHSVPTGANWHAECEGAKFHSPRPLTTLPIVVGTRVIQLCGTCRDNLTLFLHLWDANDGLPWNVLREFGNQLRIIAMLVINSREIDVS